MESVAVVGPGRVGLPLALSSADRGLRLIAVERKGVAETMEWLGEQQLAACGV